MRQTNTVTKPANLIDHVLVVEDDAVTRAKLAGYVEAAGHRVSEAVDGNEMRRIMASDPADLLVLDINLPGEDGLDLTRELRARTDIGIILVSGRTDDVDRIVGLEMGADDYVTKPFNARELVARIKNLLRRTRLSRRTETAVHQIGPWTFDSIRRRIENQDGRRVALTRAEYELLSALVAYPGTVLGRDRLLGIISHRTADPSDRTIDVLVRRLRQKLEADPQEPEFIITAHGEGYLLAIDGG